MFNLRRIIFYDREGVLFYFFFVGQQYILYTLHYKLDFPVTSRSTARARYVVSKHLTARTASSNTRRRLENN